MPATIYISYCRKTKAMRDLSARLKMLLELDGYAVVHDMNQDHFGAADNWKLKAREGLSKSDVVVVLFDRSYLDSIGAKATGVQDEWQIFAGLISAETERGPTGRGLRFLIVTIDDVDRKDLPDVAQAKVGVHWPEPAAVLGGEYAEILKLVEGKGFEASGLLRSKNAFLRSLRNALAKDRRHPTKIVSQRLSELIHKNDWDVDGAAGSQDVAKTILDRVAGIPRRTGINRLVSLCGLTLLLNPDEWAWTTAALSFVPAWFATGPNDAKFLDHNGRRLTRVMEETLKITEGKEEIVMGEARMDVLGTRGETLRIQLIRVLEQVTKDVKDRVPREKMMYKNLDCRILVRPGLEVKFSELKDPQVKDALRKTGIRVQIRSSDNLELCPFHGNRISFIPTKVNEGLPRHLYLGFNLPPGAPKNSPRPYLYVDAIPDWVRTNHGPLWFIDYAFLTFHQWFEYLWNGGSSIHDTGAE